jgi:signal transduction histidine kinase
MDQVLRNLLSNAIKFTPKGGDITIEAQFISRHGDPLKKSLPTIMSSKVPSIEDYKNHRKSTLESVKAYTEYLVGRISTNKKTAKIALDADAESGNSRDGNKKTRKYLAGKLVVKVSDTGHGISKENQGKIFNEIVQFHPETLQEVCLSICL